MALMALTTAFSLMAAFAGALLDTTAASDGADLSAAVASGLGFRNIAR